MVCLQQSVLYPKWGTGVSAGSGKLLRHAFEQPARKVPGVHAYKYATAGSLLHRHSLMLRAMRGWMPLCRDIELIVHIRLDPQELSTRYPHWTTLNTFSARTLVAVEGLMTMMDSTRPWD